MFYAFFGGSPVTKPEDLASCVQQIVANLDPRRVPLGATARSGITAQAGETRTAAVTNSGDSDFGEELKRQIQKRLPPPPSPKPKPARRAANSTDTGDGKGFAALICEEAEKLRKQGSATRTPRLKRGAHSASERQTEDDENDQSFGALLRRAAEDILGQRRATF